MHSMLATPSVAEDDLDLLILLSSPRMETLLHDHMSLEPAGDER